MSTTVRWDEAYGRWCVVVDGRTVSVHPCKRQALRAAETGVR